MTQHGNIRGSQSVLVKTKCFGHANILSYTGHKDTIATSRYVAYISFFIT